MKTKRGKKNTDHNLHWKGNAYKELNWLFFLLNDKMYVCLRQHCKSFNAQMESGHRGHQLFLQVWQRDSSSYVLTRHQEDYCNLDFFFWLYWFFRFSVDNSSHLDSLWIAVIGLILQRRGPVPERWQRGGQSEPALTVVYVCWPGERYEILCPLAPLPNGKGSRS